NSLLQDIPLIPKFTLMTTTILFRIWFILLTTLLFTTCIHAQNDDSMLCMGGYYTPEEAIEVHKEFASQYANLEEWQARAAIIQAGILTGAKLDPLPEKTPLNPIVRDKKTFDGYSVENVALEVMPGIYATGNLYRPIGLEGPYAAILSPHGHWKDPEDYGRFRPDMQYRCAMLARMGAIVFAYDMFGYGESTHGTHKHPYALKIQLWTSIRILDYLSSLPEVDKERIAITGASGGGTQAFMLTAVDDRIKVSVPVVQVSAHFFGGCACESGMPVHKSVNHQTSNVEIAALAAPRPMLLVSDGEDWTQNTPKVEFPYIQNVYRLWGASKKVKNVHLADKKKKNGINKRAAVYPFLIKHLDLNKRRLQRKNAL
ncbi:MAG: acetylxylan esterase, partial [Bacteroidetes bacterium]|nr:acetylxylan esterase [Bacteroidota bacterium]